MRSHADPAAPTQDLACIEFGFLSYFSSDVTILRADDVLVQEASGADGRETVSTTTAASPGAFDRATALIAGRGLATLAALGPKHVVLDYGTDYLRAMPPIAGFTEVRTGNPDPVLPALLTDLRAVIGGLE